MKQEKSVICMKVVDLLGNPIYRALYEIKDQKTGKVIAKGGTTIKGDIVPISRDKGTILDIYIRNMFTMDFKKLGSVTLNKDRMVATIRSPKIMIDALTTLYEGATQTYKRKTYKVKTGDTLGKIAKENGATVRVLAQLNDLKDENKLSVGQVIKLPVAILATGNHNYEEKPKTQEQPRAENKPKNSTKVEQSVVKQPTPVSATEAHKKAEEWQKQKIEQANQAKKIPVQTTPNRSETTGTPKTDVANPCQMQPQCIASGSGELIREINIRLAGFGGALPTDQFTDLTANCIKQFQRDYMGVPETGKICGSLLLALDKFSQEYSVDKYFSAMKCPCKNHGGGKQCNGFGAGRVPSYNKNAIEAPGVHRSILWSLKAVIFYLSIDKKLDVRVIGITSGYRCIENNEGHNSSGKKRTSVNHMGGTALDVAINDNSKLNYVRKNIFIKYLNAFSVGCRKTNQIFLESHEQGAVSWVHYDIRAYENINTKQNIYYATTVNDIEPRTLVEIAKELSQKILNCAGASSLKKNESNQLKAIEIDKEKNIKAFLDTIAKSEGTFDLGDNGYNVMVTGKIFNSYADHPFTHHDEALQVKGSLYSTAAGRYQIMRNNWYGTKGHPEQGLKEQYKFKDFSPKNQDTAAIILLKRRKAYNLITEGKIRTAFSTTTLSSEWASFPNAGYNQQEHSIEKLLKWYKDLGGVVTDDK